MGDGSNLRGLWGRLGSDLPESDRRFVDSATSGIEAVQKRLTAQRASLDGATRRVSALEGRDPVEVPEADWQHARHHSEALHAAASRARIEPAVGIAAAEQLHGTLTGPDEVPEWLDQVLTRFTNVDEGTILALIDAEQEASVAGALHLVRGFRGEMVVDELLAAGALPTPPGTTGGSLAETTYEAGTDLYLDVGDTVVGAQVKISDGHEAVLDHFRRHPDVEIVYTTTEAASALDGRYLPGGTPIEVVRHGDPWPADGGPVVVDLGVTSDAMSQETVAAFDAVSANASDGFLSEVVGELPVLALAFVGFRHAHRWVASDEDSGEIWADSRDAGMDVIVNAGVGAGLAAVIGVDWVKAPVTITTAVLRGQWRNTQVSLDRSHRRVQRIREVLAEIRPVPMSLTG